MRDSYRFGLDRGRIFHLEGRRLRPARESCVGGAARPAGGRASSLDAMRFSFIHAADLHIDSPLAGLGLKDRAAAERFAQAGRRAVEALVEQTIAAKA